MNVSINEKKLPNGEKSVINFYAEVPMIDETDSNRISHLFLSYWNDNTAFCLGYECDFDTDILVSIPHSIKNIHEVMNFLRDCENAHISYSEINNIISDIKNRLNSK